MSQPKRYRFTSNNIDGINIGVVMQEDDNGYFITYADYVALAAENERLRKAGDDVVRNIEVASQGLFCAIRRWDAAKEGGGSK